ncbi:hypothetical protein RJ641_025635 [Dillenia turbinata]|uniref:Uncharacterized protein n=1 Tax=Dillenia turbinata TaxID=194707 RepID=A0AAN8WDI0_9MAGN
MRSGLLSGATDDKTTVIELLCPSVFRAIVSLHPADSIEPDAVAFFCPDEEHAAMALQYFLGVNTDKAFTGSMDIKLYLQNKCERLLSMDKQRALLLPPINCPYQHFSVTKISSMQAVPSTKDNNLDVFHAYHIDCFIEES